MSAGDDIRFHSTRAMIELDLAARASCAKAARAHFGLSALHLERMRRLTDVDERARSRV